MLYHNFYRIGLKVKELSAHKRNGYGEFCSVCYSPNCKIHDEGVEDYSSALQQLQEWQSVCFRYLMDNALVIDNTPIPLWPSNKGDIDLTVPYLVFPKLNSPLYAIVSRKELYGINQEGELVSDLDDYLDSRTESLSEGVYWGYLIEEVFYLIRAYKEGRWTSFQRLPKLPYVKFENMDLLDTDLNQFEDLTVGYWMVPKVPENYKFMKKCVYF